MDFIKFCNAVDAAALKHVSEVIESCYLDEKQQRVYLIGRINEDIKKLYPNARLETDYRSYNDPHDLGTWDYIVTTLIEQDGVKFWYETMIRKVWDTEQYKIMQRVRPLIVQFQERVQQYATTEFTELSGNSQLSTSEFINQLEERIANRLEDYYKREGFEVNITAHCGLTTSYTIQAEDPLGGACITLELSTRLVDQPVPEPWACDVKMENGVVELKTVYENKPEEQKKLNKVQAIVEIVNAAQKKLSDLHLEYEATLGEPATEAKLQHLLFDWLSVFFGEKFTFDIKVETTTEAITVWIEESASGCKTRLRSTRKLEKA